MLHNFFISILRSLKRNRINSTVHILGLTLGIGSALVLILFAYHELSYDKFHENKDEIYMVYKERLTPDGIQPAYDTWVPMLEQMQIDFPEVESGTRLFNDNATVTIEDRQFTVDAVYVDSTFFNIFSFPITHGNQKNPFENINSVIITKETSIKLFGNDHAVGEELRVDYQNVYTVSGIVDHVPRNSSIQFEIVLPITSNPDYSRFAESWGGSFLSTYIILSEFSEVEILTSKFPDFIEKIWDEETRARTNFKLLPMPESYDTFIGDSSDSYILIYIAIGILLIASINFMNLATATSVDRAKEIGMRKVLGSSPRLLAIRFLGETLFTTYIALIFGTLLAKAVIPGLNQLFDMEIALDLTRFETLMGLFSFATMLGLLSGIYPAFFIANFPILKSLKNSVSSGRGGVRKVLVVIQFALSTSLIIISLIVWNQLSYMVKADLSYNQHHLIVVPVSSRNFEDSDDAGIRIQSYRDEIHKNSAIISSSTSTHVPSQWSRSNAFVKPLGWEGDPLRMRYTYHDATFFDTYGIELIDGPGFLPDSAGNQRGSVILNEAAAKAFGFSDSNEKTIVLGNNNVEVVGIIKDFNFETLRSEITPILHFHRVPSNGVHQYITIKTNPERVNETLKFLEDRWSIVSNEPFDYFFLEERLKEMYAAEDRLLKMVSAFTIVTIFVACLGLYGLSSFMIDKRKKEMGIRKVLGASGVQVFYTVAGKFTLFIFLGFLFALPLSYFLSGEWLKDFANVAPIGISIYIGALLVTLFVGVLTISYKSLAAATMNPIDTLRDE